MEQKEIRLYRLLKLEVTNLSGLKSQVKDINHTNQELSIGNVGA